MTQIAILTWNGTTLNAKCEKYLSTEIEQLLTPAEYNNFYNAKYNDETYN